jgi:hypothetical protein
LDPRLASILALAATATLAAIFWLWLGRARGGTKRAAWRLFLFALATALVAAGRSQGLFARASLPFDLALAAIVILVVIGNLYSVRFCTGCGRMHRNFKLGTCSRCGDALPQHGFTEAPRRAPIDPTDPLGRKKRS